MIWLFKCDCGNYHKSVGCKVSSGNTKSCGKCNKHYFIENAEGGVIKILLKNRLKMLVGVKDGYKKKNKR